MEATGLIVGVVGLAGLFSSCLEAVDKVQSYGTFGSDSQALDAQFKATKARFERWGPAVGIKQGRLLDTHQTALDSQEVKTAVEELLLAIKFIYDADDAGGVPPRRTPAIGPSNAVSSGSQRLQGAHNATSGSKRTKLAWAIWRKKGRTEEVELFEKLVQGLHDLVPLEWDRGKQPTREPGPRRPDALAPGTDIRPGAWPPANQEQGLHQITRGLVRFGGSSIGSKRIGPVRLPHLFYSPS
jgi:hypothetical protein